MGAASGFSSLLEEFVSSSLDGVTVTENYENAIVGRDFVEKVDFTPKTYLLRAKFYENLMSSRA